MGPSYRSVTAPPAGLCLQCRHGRRVPAATGSTFVLCRRSTIDPAYPRYPRLPVEQCAGFEAGLGPDLADAAGPARRGV